MSKLLVFTSIHCHSCHEIIKMLKKEEVPFTEVDVNDSKNYDEQIKCNVRSTPTFVIKDDNDKIVHSIIGFRRVNEIKDALHI